MAIRARIGFFGAGVVFVTVVIFSVLVYALVNRSVLEQQDNALSRRSQQFATGQRPDGPGGAQLQPGGTRLRDPGMVDLRTSSDSFVEVLADDGSAIFSTGVIDGQAPAVSSALLRQVDLNGSVLTTTEPSKGVFLRESIRKRTAFAFGPIPSTGTYVVAGQPLGPL